MKSNETSASSGMSKHLSRRTVLRGAAGTAALLTVPAVLTACGDDSGGGDTATGDTGSDTGGDTATEGNGSEADTGGGTLTIGSNFSNAQVKSAFAKVASAFGDESGADVSVNTTDHNTYQNKIQTYLQGTPDDVFSWFAGYRMQFFASQGLAEPIDDVWDTIGSHFSDAIKAASIGADGHYYFVPLYNYPWVMNYRKSVFDENGYKIPKTWDELIALCDQMKSDGLVPISLGDKGGWPAMGIFDIINMRMNGYQFHVDLMAHKESWTDPKTVAVFDQWKKLMPYFQTGANGRTWDQAAQDLQNKKTGMMFIGAGQAGQQFSDENLPDLHFFAFPEINPEHGTDSIDAPIDGFMMSKDPEHPDTAKAFLEFLGTPEAEAIYLATDPTNVGAAKDYDTSTYNDLQKASAEIIANTAHIAQFLDRDTRPDFAYPIVQDALHSFISDQDSKAVCERLETQAKAIFPA